MRRLYVTLHLLLLCLCAHSQHLSFSGIDIDGNVNTFIQKLNKIGFKENGLTKYLIPTSEPGKIGNIIGTLLGEEVWVDVRYNPKNLLVTEVDVWTTFETEKEVLRYINKVNNYIKGCYFHAVSNPTTDSRGNYFDFIVCANRANGRPIPCGEIIVRYAYYGESYNVSIEFVDENYDK